MNNIDTVTEKQPETSETQLILLAHGSSDPAWQIPFQKMTQSIADNQKYPVTLAFMELCRPSLEDIALSFSAEKNYTLEILPLFFSAGRHLKKDVPEQIKVLSQKHPHLTIKLHEPVGGHPKMMDALTAIAGDLDFFD